GSSGITDSWNTGLNFNTSRFKNLELTPSINGGGTRTLNESQEEKTTFRREGSDMHSSDTSRNLSHNNTLSAGVELKYTPERVRITFSPRFSFTNSNSQRQSASTTGSLGDTYDILNDAYSYNYSTSRNLSSQGNLMVGFRIGEKAGRTITVSGNWSISEGDDDAKEFSETNYYQADSVKHIDQYSHTDSRNIGFGGELRYTEPISEYWFLTGSYRVSYRHNTSNKDTYDYYGSAAHNRSNASSFVGTMDNADQYTCGPRNDYYSSEVDNTYINQNIGLAMQLQKGRNFIQAGASLQPTYNETFTRSFGTESHLGEGEWLLNWAPEVRARYALNENSNINGSYQGRSSQPSNSRMQPILNVSNPTSISTGNAYLLPSFSHSVNMRYSTNNKKRFSSFFGGLTASRDIGSVVTASWFDNDGIRYSIPVNSKKPSNNLSADASYNTPIGKSKFNVSASLRGSLGTSVSYQNTSPRGGIDAAKFDYTTFMEEFWGNDSAGRKFYSGESGFGESQTNTYSTSESLNIRYNGDVISFNVGGTSRYSHATYSLNSAANRTTWNNTLNGELFVNIRKITWSTDYNYNFYRGYSDGFNEPEFIWNMALNATIRKINISASIHDILAQSRNIVRTTTENYVSDRMTNRLGRYFMVTATYRFGSFPGMKGRNMRGGGMGGPMMMPGGGG
ncbi:MAG: outer membrane beta-barrel protein, partial [Bacteroidales bacterium]|nr:outer membrane beta-barrel protein [Bacteroidales bacterium]